MTKKQLKAKVRERDGKCVDCGAVRSIGNKTLHVHRLVPGSKYSLEGCVALCHACHAARHRKREYIPTSGKVDLLPYLVTADYLDELRQALGVRANKFAAMLGVSESSVSYWQSGRSHPRWSTLVKLNELIRHLEGDVGEEFRAKARPTREKVAS